MPEQENPDGTVVTSLKVNGDLWKKAKIRAIEEDTTLTKFVNEALEMRLGSKREFGDKSKLKGGKL